MSLVFFACCYFPSFFFFFFNLSPSLCNQPLSSPENIKSCHRKKKKIPRDFITSLAIMIIYGKDLMVTSVAGTVSFLVICVVCFYTLQTKISACGALI